MAIDIGEKVKLRWEHEFTYPAMVGKVFEVVDIRGRHSKHNRTLFVKDMGSDYTVWILSDYCEYA